MKRIVFLIIATLLVLGLVLPGCGTPTPPAGPVTYNFTGGVIKIAIAGPMTYIQGKHMWWGAELARDEINAAGGVNISGVYHNISLIKVDTQEISPPWSTYPAEQVENAITVQGAQFVMGGFRSEAVAGMINKAMDLKKMFFIAGSATGAFLKQVNDNYNKYKYLFRATPLNESFLFFNNIGILQMVGATISATLASLNCTITKPRVAFLAENLQWCQVPLANVKYYVETALNYTYLGKWTVSDTATDISTQLNAIQALQPHLIFTFLSGPVGITYGLQMASLNISAMSMGINVEGSDPGYWAATNGTCVGMMNLVTWAPNVNQTAKTQPFITAFKAKSSGTFPIYNAATYDMILTLEKAIEAKATYNVTGLVLADDLIAWFENPANAQVGTTGVSGYYTLAHQGLVTAGVPAYAHDLKYGVINLTNQWATGLGGQWVSNGSGGGNMLGVWPKAAYSVAMNSLCPYSAALGLNWTGFEWPGTVGFTVPGGLYSTWCAYTP